MKTVKQTKLYSIPDRRDAYIKVSKVILSCKNIMHMNTAVNMIQNYITLYGEDPLYNQLTKEYDLKCKSLNINCKSSIEL